MILLAVSSEHVLMAEKVLAVVGGGVLGGLGVPLLAQLITKSTTTQKLPRWAVLTLRLLGAIACGWLVALWVFGGGGPGIGGGGGWGFGSGPGKGDGPTPPTKTSQSDGTKKDGQGPAVPAAETMRIEVLGPAPLKVLGPDSSHCYRTDPGDGPRLLTFEEVKEAIKTRQKKEPPLRRIEIVLYKDSPDERVGLVSRLRSWAADLDVKGDGKMKVDLSSPDANAPVKE